MALGWKIMLPFRARLPDRDRDRESGFLHDRLGWTYDTRFRARVVSR